MKRDCGSVKAENSSITYSDLRDSFSQIPIEANSLCNLSSGD